MVLMASLTWTPPYEAQIRQHKHFGAQGEQSRKKSFEKTPTLCPLCWDLSVTSNLTMASHLARVWGSQAVTTRISCLEGTCRCWAEYRVPSALTLKSRLLVSYRTPLLPAQLLNFTRTERKRWEKCVRLA